MCGTGPAACASAPGAASPAQIIMKRTLADSPTLNQVQQLQVNAENAKDVNKRLLLVETGILGYWHNAATVFL